MELLALTSQRTIEGVPEEGVLEFKANIFKVLGDANRLKILEVLRRQKICQCELIPLIEQSQPTVSRHLRLLEEMGLISSYKEGTKVFYDITDDHIFNLIDSIDKKMIEVITEKLREKYMPL
ncbi:metalloregulator ArsR/SmtB family transcription factor [Candidatus Bathyarchaeota archaeon]|nr:metalloregulator ArsR/SmtB family transcription factor [Candidatus Bathyarchaeota archaeon]